MRKREAGFVLALGITGGGCGATLHDRLENARYEDCDVVLSDHPKVTAEAGYRTEPEGMREFYESRVAGCYLDKRRPEKAIALASSWKDDAADALTIEARANAALGRDKEARSALETLAAKGRTTVEFLLETPEFRGYAGKDWFVSVAVDVWAKAMDRPLDEMVRKLTARGGARLLSLEVAAADAQRPGGEWALWTGLVQESHIDRSTDTTYVVAEGVDIKENLVFVDRKIAAIRPSSLGGLKTEIDEKRWYAEAFVPNGRKFVVVYPKVSENIVRMKAVTALGHYTGRSQEEGLPSVAAMLVLAPRPKEHSENGP